ncbi:GNAT family N-acetyltransferase [Nocardiopsis alba]|uniref:GNAT family N-acetyltransferase n=1 Tax=Nocardiopsis alba TaxID=53437 RepID=UPI0036715AE3
MTDAQPTVADAGDRYTITDGGEVAGFTRYVDAGNRRIFFHTEIEDRFAGRGLARTLVERALDHTRGLGMRIVPACPYVHGYVDRHHDFDDALEPVTPEILEIVRTSQY